VRLSVNFPKLTAFLCLLIPLNKLQSQILLNHPPPKFSLYGLCEITYRNDVRAIDSTTHYESGFGQNYYLNTDYYLLDPRFLKFYFKWNFQNQNIDYKHYSIINSFRKRDIGYYNLKISILPKEFSRFFLYLRKRAVFLNSDYYPEVNTKIFSRGLRWSLTPRKLPSIFLLYDNTRQNYEKGEEINEDKRKIATSISLLKSFKNSTILKFNFNNLNSFDYITGRELHQRYILFNGEKNLTKKIKIRGNLDYSKSGTLNTHSGNLNFIMRPSLRISYYPYFHYLFTSTPSMHTFSGDVGNAFSMIGKSNISTTASISFSKKIVRSDTIDVNQQKERIGIRTDYPFRYRRTRMKTSITFNSNFLQYSDKGNGIETKHKGSLGISRIILNNIFGSFTYQYMVGFTRFTERVDIWGNNILINAESHLGRGFSFRTNYSFEYGARKMDDIREKKTIDQWDGNLMWDWYKELYFTGSYSVRGIFSSNSEHYKIWEGKIFSPITSNLTLELGGGITTNTTNNSSLKRCKLKIEWRIGQTVITFQYTRGGYKNQRFGYAAYSPNYGKTGSGNLFLLKITRPFGKR